MAHSVQPRGRRFRNQTYSEAFVRWAVHDAANWELSVVSLEESNIGEVYTWRHGEDLIAGRCMMAIPFRPNLASCLRRLRGGS